MPTEQIEFTAEQTASTPEETELIEKLNCLEFEAAQLNRAYALWRSCVEQGTATDWMAAATRITYDALITFYIEVSAILADVPHSFSARPLAQLQSSRCQISGILREERTTAHTELRTSDAARGPREDMPPELLPMTEPDWSGPEMQAAISPASTGDAISEQPAEQTELTTEQIELIEKLNCLEFETALLNRAYQSWSPYVEQGTAPQWMIATIRISYDALITFCLEVSTILADVPQGVSARPLALLQAAPIEVSGVLTEESTPAGPSLELLPMTEPDWFEPEMPAATSPTSAGQTIWEQPAIQPGQQEEEEADVPLSSSTVLLAQLKSAAWCEVSGILEEESPTADPSPELSPATERDWSAPEMPAAFSSPSNGNAISEQPAILRSQQDDEAGTEPATIRTLATLAANWLQGSSTGILFFIPPGALGRIVRATCVAILVAAGGTVGIYVASARRAASKPAVLPVQNSASQAAAGDVAIPTGERAEFKFAPDPVVAPLGRSFVLNAVLSRGSDIASVAVQIDYDATLLKFVGVSEGGYLAQDGRQVVLAQRDDPLTGVLRISAEKSPGNPGISGDGQVFALSFQARKRGKTTVSIIPGAHDSQGRRIEVAGSQVSVRVN